MRRTGGAGRVRSGVLAHPVPAVDAAPTAAEQREDEEAADASCEADDEGLVFVDPAADAAAFAFALGEVSTSTRKIERRDRKCRR